MPPGFAYSEISRQYRRAAFREIVLRTPPERLYGTTLFLFFNGLDTDTHTVPPVPPSSHARAHVRAWARIRMTPLQRGTAEQRQ